jgi:hypothetical protein
VLSSPLIVLKIRTKKKCVKCTNPIYIFFLENNMQSDIQIFCPLIYCHFSYFLLFLLSPLSPTVFSQTTSPYSFLDTPLIPPVFSQTTSPYSVLHTPPSPPVFSQTTSPYSVLDTPPSPPPSWSRTFLHYNNNTGDTIVCSDTS